MSLSLIIYEHPTPAEMYPLLATKDPAIISALREIILERLDDEVSSPSLRLAMPCKRAPKEPIP